MVGNIRMPELWISHRKAFSLIFKDQGQELSNLNNILSVHSEIAYLNIIKLF